MEAGHIKFRKSRVVLPGQGINGGPKGTSVLTSGKMHDVFPRAGQQTLEAGSDEKIKIFFCYEDPNGGGVTDFELAFKLPTPAEDVQLMGLGSHESTEADIEGDPPVWIGAGQLSADPSGMDTVQLNMESDTAEFAPGGKIYLSNTFMTSQVIDDGAIPGRPAVKIGDSCEISAGVWRKASYDDYEYPHGFYCGDNIVMTLQSGDVEAKLTLAEKLTSAEMVGSGDGVSSSPALSGLANVTNGLMAKASYKPKVYCQDGDSNELTVYIQADGTASGDCTAGEIDLSSGVWITDISWTAPPAGDIYCDYYDKNFSYSGQTVTVELAEICAESLNPARSFGSGMIEVFQIQADIGEWSKTSVSGAFDSSKIVLNPAGAEDDELVFEFTSSSDFTCEGAYLGSIGSGVITADFAPVNPNTGYPFLTVQASAWSGAWAAGDSVSIPMISQAQGLWWRRIIPEGANSAPSNLYFFDFWGA